MMCSSRHCCFSSISSAMLCRPSPTTWAWMRVAAATTRRPTTNARMSTPSACSSSTNLGSSFRCLSGRVPRRTEVVLGGDPAGDARAPYPFGGLEHQRPAGGPHVGQGLVELVRIQRRCRTGSARRPPSSICLVRSLEWVTASASRPTRVGTHPVIPPTATARRRSRSSCPISLIDRPRSVAACWIRARCPVVSVLSWRPPGTAGITSRTNRSIGAKLGVRGSRDGWRRSCAWPEPRHVTGGGRPARGSSAPRPCGRWASPAR